jgi:hypothetical protein
MLKIEVIRHFKTSVYLHRLRGLRSKNIELLKELNLFCAKITYASELQILCRYTPRNLVLCPDQSMNQTYHG